MLMEKFFDMINLGRNVFVGDNSQEQSGALPQARKWKVKDGGNEGFICLLMIRHVGCLGEDRVPFLNS